MATSIPWQDDATVVLMSPSNGTGTDTGAVISTTAFEGTLREAVRFLRQRTVKTRGSYRIGLPDRHQPPFGYQGEALDLLISSIPRIWE